MKGVGGRRIENEIYQKIKQNNKQFKLKMRLSLHAMWTPYFGLVFVTQIRIFATIISYI